MAKKDYYVAGLDLGSFKTRALICQPGEGGKLEVTGFGEADSRGWRKGVIVNLDAVVLPLKKAVEQAEAQAGLPVETAYVGVGGAHIKGVNSRGGLSLGKANKDTREVTQEDVTQVIQTAQGIALPPDRERLYVEQQEYLVDSQGDFRNPVGMAGSRLEVNVHIITASKQAHQNVVTAVNRAGVEVKDTVYEPLASGLACLAPDDRELGVALVDIGAGSTDLIVYSQGSVRHTAVVPVGGEHFTNDVAVGLRTPIPEAEKMKRAWGERDTTKPSYTVLEVSSVGERPMRAVSYAMLSEILEPRGEELMELVQAELARSGLEKQLGAGVVLVGGGAKLGGLAAIAEAKLGMPVRVASPRGLGKMTETLSDPAYATLVGLIAYANRIELFKDKDKEETGWKGRLWKALGVKGD
jgi:cell division protein FtsA